jgi:hypothetical protein
MPTSSVDPLGIAALSRILTRPVLASHMRATNATWLLVGDAQVSGVESAWSECRRLSKTPPSQIYRDEDEAENDKCRRRYRQLPAWSRCEEHDHGYDCSSGANNQQGCKAATDPMAARRVFHESKRLMRGWISGPALAQTSGPASCPRPAV